MIELHLLLKSLYKDYQLYIEFARLLETPRMSNIYNSYPLKKEQKSRKQKQNGFPSSTEQNKPKELNIYLLGLACILFNSLRNTFRVLVIISVSGDSKLYCGFAIHYVGCSEFSTLMSFPVDVYLMENNMEGNYNRITTRPGGRMESLYRRILYGDTKSNFRTEINSNLLRLVAPLLI